jgi:exodeoxyribonuclease V beta subunit
VASAAEDEWEEVHRRLHEWARVLRVRGVAALLETITLIEGLPGRVLSLQDGERRLTDLRHLGQLLHAAAAAERLGATALTGWLRHCASGSPPPSRRPATRSAAAAWSPTPRPSRC